MGNIFPSNQGSAFVGVATVTVLGKIYDGNIRKGRCWVIASAAGFKRM